MNFSKDSAVQQAKADLAKRLSVSENEVKEVSVSEKDFPDMSLGAPVADEMSAQMISTGWQINLEADGKKYEYRADKYQLRLNDFQGTNYLIESWSNLSKHKSYSRETARGKLKIMEDKELKKRLAKIPDADKNGDPIYKIADIKTSGKQSEDKSRHDKKRDSK